jgi:hypothetical protein
MNLWLQTVQDGECTGERRGGATCCWMPEHSWAGVEGQLVMHCALAKLQDTWNQDDKAPPIQCHSKTIHWQCLTRSIFCLITGWDKKMMWTWQSIHGEKLFFWELGLKYTVWLTFRWPLRNLLLCICPCQFSIWQVSAPAEKDFLLPFVTQSWNCSKNLFV